MRDLQVRWRRALGIAEAATAVAKARTERVLTEKCIVTTLELTESQSKRPGLSCAIILLDPLL